jgi:RHS repeat-associated protein
LVTEYKWNVFDKVKRVTLPTGWQLHYQYDPALRLLSVSDAEAPLVSYTYDANGNTVTKGDGLQNIWIYEYDRLDRLKKLFDAIVETGAEGDRFTEYEYDGAGNVTAIINNNFIKTCMLYDRLNRLEKVVEDCMSDCGGDGKKELDGEAEEAIQSEDPMGGGTPLVATGTCNTAAVEYMYDGRFLITLKDHDGNPTHYHYDSAGRVTDVFYPDSGQMAYPTSPCGVGGQGCVHYDYFSNAITRRDQRSITTIFTFDQLGWLQRREYSPYRREDFTFDRLGRLTKTKRYVSGSSTNVEFHWTRVFDLAGRVTQEKQEYGTDQYVTNATYSLDSAGQVYTQSLTYPGVRVVDRVFDKLQRLSTVSGGNIGASWSFDHAFRRSNEVRANGVQDLFYYDANNRLAAIVRPTQLGGPEGPVVVDLTEYGYDPVGNRKWTRNIATTPTYGYPPEWSEYYGYDNRDRLTGMDRGEIFADNSGVQTPLDHAILANKQQWDDLDRRGNWLDYRETIGTTLRKEDRVPDAVNAYTCIDPLAALEGITQLCDFRPTHVTPAYDLAGNMAFNPLAPVVGDPMSCTPAIPGCPSGQEYVYDQENRVVAVHKDTNDAPGPFSGGVLTEPKVLEFKYDALGRRVETVEYLDPQSGATLTTPKRTRHIYSGMEMIQEYVCYTTTSTCPTSWELGAEFVWGDPARYPEPIAMVWYATAGNPPPPSALPAAYHYLRDVLGSVVGLTDEDGNLVERYTYDPYGKPYIERWNGSTWVANICGGGSPALGSMCYSAFGNPFGWTGQRYDAATGTYAFPMRLYLPSLGRWGQRDPVGYVDGINLYEYVRGRAPNLVDPLGLFAPPSSSQPVPPPTSSPAPMGILLGRASASR